MHPHGSLQAPEDRRKKKIAIMGVCSVILVAMVVAVAVGVSNRGSGGGGGGSGDISATTKAVRAICQPTDYKESCEESLAGANTTDPKELIRLGFQATMKQINMAIKDSKTLEKLEKDKDTSNALKVCQEVLDLAIDDLQDSFDQLGAFDITKMDDYLSNLKIWISGSITYRETCLDAFENSTSEAAGKMKNALKLAGELSSNALKMVTEIQDVIGSMSLGPSRRLLTDEEHENGGGLPNWVDAGKRKLLFANFNNVKPDRVVAKDGSGQYKTITEALVNIPIRKDNKTFVIYVKAGVYDEQVEVSKRTRHIMMYGDGPTKTRVTGKLNAAEGIKTMKTATFSAIGAEFVAKDMGFENTAGARGHQAVALRVNSDMSIFYNCHMDGYQDTLYTHAHRQFFRDCTVSGTIDFIFGDAAAVFQNCKMVVRKPLPNQQCMVTAQGRSVEGEPTGIILQNCTITGEPEYTRAMANPSQNPQLRSYLGRPWKAYSRTIIMNSQIDDVIHADGWTPWAGMVFENTCFYGEFNNRGRGSTAAKRVKWKGIRQITPQMAAGFTPGKFLDGDKWIKPTGVPYVPGMISV